MSDLTDLSVQAIDANRLDELRLRAASRLGSAATPRGATARAVDALSVLHTLASSPATAPDALALLHELQVHQVELDLQAQELQESRAELESALRRQAERHDALPVGCFEVDAHGTLLELNRTGADLLGLPGTEASGLPLGAFLGGDGAQRLRAALEGLAGDSPPPALTLELTPRSGGARPVLAHVARDTVAGRCLVCLSSL